MESQNVSLDLRGKLSKVLVGVGGFESFWSFGAKALNGDFYLIEK